jgi:hypothetical protein
MADIQFSVELVSGLTAIAKLAEPKICPLDLATTFIV